MSYINLLRITSVDIVSNSVDVIAYEMVVIKLNRYGLRLMLPLLNSSEMAAIISLINPALSLFYTWNSWPFFKMNV
jgi:hypothetical protein